MAQFITFSILVIVLLAITVVTMVEPRKITEEFSSLAPSPGPSSSGLKQYHYIQHCGTYLTDKCGEETYKFVFENSKSYTDDCCDNLVAMGNECHTAMIEYYVELSHLQANAPRFFGNGEIIWKQCYKSIFSPTSAAPSPVEIFSDAAPPPQLSPEERAYDQYLENCVATLTEKCEEEVFSFVFGNSLSYTNDCCKKLVATGRQCHVDMIDYSVQMPQFKANSSVFWAKSDQIWIKCSSVA